MAEEDLLAKYIVGDLYKFFADDRKAILEPQWRRNYDAFRGRYSSSALKKWRATEGSNWRSKVFCRLTKQKVVTGLNQVSALMIQGGKLPWSVSPTPVPRNMSGVLIDPVEAEARCVKMSRYIADDLSECDSVRTYLTAALENAIYGVSFIRGPILKPFSSMAVDFGLPGVPDGMYMPDDVVRKYGKFTMAVTQETRPVIDTPSVWNMFWDLEASSHQTGHGIIYLETMSRGRFADLAWNPGYDKKAILEIQAGFSGQENGSDVDSDLGPLIAGYTARKRVIPVYTFYGRVPRKYLLDTTPDLPDDDGREVEIYCVCAGGAGSPRVIRKPVVNPLPYRHIHMAKWQDLVNEPGGIGTPEDIEDTQMIINGLTRAMMDNKAISSNLLSVWNPRMLAPGQSKSLYPGKAFELNEAVEDPRQAMYFFSPPDVTGSTPQLIELFKQSADDESGFGRILDGSANGTRKTAYEMSRVVESGNKMIGAICRNHDVGFIEPLIRSMYHYHMICGDDESAKGDFQCKALGFQSFQDKAERAQSLLELAQFTLSNQFTAHYAKIGNFLSKLASIRDFDPDELFYSDDQVNQMASALQGMLPGGQAGPGVPAGVGMQGGMA